MNKQAAIYARVSTSGQTTDNQLRELRKVAKRQGWSVVAEYVDNGKSGALGRDKRPQLDSLLKAAVRKEFDVVMAWSVDRLGRSLQHLVELLSELHAKDVDLYLHQQAIDTTTPAGRALFQMMGIFAEFERAIMQERIKAGLARARAQGKKLGRPKIAKAMEARIRTLRKTGAGKKKIARELGIGTGTVNRVLAESQ